jgi:hypothetical protein
MSPTTPIPVFLISVAIAATSQSSAWDRCWICRQFWKETQGLPAPR